MSAQAGTWYFDERPVPRHIVEWTGHQLDPLGPDGSGAHVEPGLFMVHRALHVTLEDRAEQQPYRARDFVLTWDGRLDNRADLLLQLGAAASTSDVELVVRGYEKWGLDALPRLIGDWSCAIWDRTSRRVHLASDYMGNRPLYWQRTRDALRWSSTLAAFPREELTLDDEFMLGFLMVGAPPDSTPYRGVSSLSPGHVLTCGSGGAIGEPGKVSLTRFYQFPRERLTYRDDRDYEERFRELLADAVGSRMRAGGPVWAELSGGFDSSAIVCMGASLLDQRRVATPSFHTVSHIADGSPESTEERFVDVVLEATRVPSLKMPLSAFDAMPDSDPAQPKHRSATISSICHHMRQSGARTLLSGRMGDGIAGNFPENFPAVLEPLKRGRPFECLMQARAWSLASKKPVIEVLATATKAFGSGRRYGTYLLDESLRHHRGTRAASTASLAEIFGLARDVDRKQLGYVGSYALAAAQSGPPWQQQMLSMLCRYQMRRSLSAWAPDPRVVYTYPFAHRPLVEFALTIPSHVLISPGEPRRLMRRALSGLLPPRILRRFSKGYAAPHQARTFQAIARTLRDSAATLHLVKLGYLDQHRLHERLTAFLSGADARMGNLWHIAVLEQWLARAREPSLSKAS
jgi:asparagine synthase (glutamine-hydrolysing)